jgi:two-component system chemotaxis response regulator CheY
MLKVLAVDDSRTMRDLITAALVDVGIEVTTAEDGLDGLAKLRVANPDVIISDINMPNLDGFGFIKAVRDGSDDLLACAVPILVLSTESSHEFKAKAKLLGATGWIVKPFDPDKLAAAVHRVAG